MSVRACVRVGVRACVHGRRSVGTGGGDAFDHRRVIEHPVAFIRKMLCYFAAH